MEVAADVVVDRRVEEGDLVVEDMIEEAMIVVTLLEVVIVGDTEVDREDTHLIDGDKDSTIKIRRAHGLRNAALYSG